jgi:DNA-directed RNA polymerase subunit RPC12/RpoP
VLSIKIQEIRDYLSEHTGYFSSKNNIEIKDIKSQNKYYFIADCCHEFLSQPTNVFVDNELHCPVCSGRQVVKGVNDMWTTHPELAALLANPEDGYKYTANTHKELLWFCKDCKREFYMQTDKFKIRLHKCPYCSENKSYGEKFLYNLLEQLYIPFEMHKTFEWSDKKEYDFYIPELSCIIEVHGKQHYTKSDFSYLGGKHYYEEMANDEYKKEIALTNGILRYIVIDARESNITWIMKSICNSDLPIILRFNHKEILWEECDKYALGNEVKLVCEKYNELEDIQLVADYFHCSYNTVKNKLKQGATHGWCNYDADAAQQQAWLENGKKVIEIMSKPVVQFDLNGNFIKKYPSIQFAQRELKISHIWDCIIGRRKSAGGYQWRYLDDCDNVNHVCYEQSGKPKKSINQYDMNINLIKTWNSINEAARELNINKSGIIAVCNNRQKTAGGFIWRYNNGSSK